MLKAGEPKDFTKLPFGLVSTFFDAVRLRPPGGLWSFFVPGMSLGLELYIDFDKMRSAAILALKLYPQTLSGNNTEEVASKGLLKFALGGLFAISSQRATD